MVSESPAGTVDRSLGLPTFASGKWHACLELMIAGCLLNEARPSACRLDSEPRPLPKKRPCRLALESMQIGPDRGWM